MIRSNAQDFNNNTQEIITSKIEYLIVDYIDDKLDEEDVSSINLPLPK